MLSEQTTKELQRQVEEGGDCAIEVQPQGQNQRPFTVILSQNRAENVLKQIAQKQQGGATETGYNAPAQPQQQWTFKKIQLQQSQGS